MKPNSIQLLIILFVILWAGNAFGQAHTATYAIDSTSCTTATPCTAQIWRVVMPGNSSCPAAGNAAYINVVTSLAPATQASNGSHWDYTDTGSTLTSGSTYCGYKTVTFNSGGGPSGASAIFQGTIPTPPVAPPPPTGTVILK